MEMQRYRIVIFLVFYKHLIMILVLSKDSCMGEPATAVSDSDGGDGVKNHFAPGRALPHAAI